MVDSEVFSASVVCFGEVVEVVGSEIVVDVVSSGVVVEVVGSWIIVDVVGFGIVVGSGVVVGRF